MSIIVYAPQGNGLVVKGPRLLAHFRLTRMYEPYALDLPTADVYDMPLGRGFNSFLFKAGTNLFLTHTPPPEELIDSRRVVALADAMESCIAAELSNEDRFKHAIRCVIDSPATVDARVDEVTVPDVLVHLGVPSSQWTFFLTRSVGSVLIELGWVRHRQSAGVWMFRRSAAIAASRSTSN